MTKPKPPPPEVVEEFRRDLEAEAQQWMETAADEMPAADGETTQT